MATSLPTEKSQPKTDIRDMTTLLYGPPKIGKSTFAAAADGALFLATEQGLNFLSVYQIEIQTWASFLEACREIAKGEHQFRTVVIDTIDNLYRACVDHVLTKAGIAHQSDLEYGKGYDLVNTKFQKRLTALSLLPYGLIMISHSVEKEVKTRTGKATFIAPTLPNSARKIVLGMADFILYAASEEITDADGTITGYDRVVHSQPTTIYEAGNRSQYAIPDPLPLSYSAFVATLKEASAKKTSTDTDTGKTSKTDTTQTGGNK
jgi:hypothetical protein